MLVQQLLGKQRRNHLPLNPKILLILSLTRNPCPPIPTTTLLTLGSTTINKAKSHGSYKWLPASNTTLCHLTCKQKFGYFTCTSPMTHYTAGFPEDCKKASIYFFILISSSILSTQ